jgi:ATP-dependent helicase HepA
MTVTNVAKQISKGQRWMSTAEPELGLGMVVECDRRMLKLLFPATGEMRAYAVESAPIERVLFKPGDRIRTHAGVEFAVTEVESVDGILHYSGDGKTAPETALADTINLATADRRLLDGRADTTELFALRRRALEHRSRIQRHPAHGYFGARMDLIPHQLYIAREVAERPAPRVLLADEVGLGKTIEACLILHRLYVRGHSGRVLILVPEPLIHQWFVELYRRFNMTCAIFDEERCSAIQGATGERNPFLDEHLILTSPSLFLKHPDRLKEALGADWGLVIVDEAHHLKWSPDEVSPEYRLVEALGRKSKGLLLLTGTPEQFGEEGHFARLHLLDPERFHDYASFQKETAAYRQTAEVVDKLILGQVLAARDKKTVEKLFALENGKIDPEAAKRLAALEKEDAEARAFLVEDLLDRHGTGRAVFRNTRAAIAGFPERKVHAAPLSAPKPGLEDSGKTPDEIIWQETAFELGLCDGLSRKPLEKDPRIDWLIKLLKKHPDEKFLLICRYQKRAEHLYETVRSRFEIPMTVFHEEQTIIQRDRNAAWFAQPAPEGARLLICSEIGSEGRNFQFAHHLVLWDLPCDPELLEQRIGRLDRIGQRSTIHLHVPFFKGGGEALFRWFHEGIDAFAHPIQGGALYLEKFLPRLRKLVKTKEKSADAGEKELEVLIADTQAFRKELKKRLEEGRDRLLERHSFRPETIKPLIAQIRELDGEPDLEDFLLHTLDHFGVHVEALNEVGKRTWVLTPGHLLTDQLTVIPPEGKTVTLDRATALGRDDIEFVTWDHPLVISLLDLLLFSEAGNAAFSDVKSKSDDLAPGLYVEMIYLLEGSSPPQFDLKRFLPVTPIRLLLNAAGDVSDAAALAVLDKAPVTDAPKSALAGNAAVLKPLLEQCKDRAGEEVDPLAIEVRKRALAAMRQTLARELERLESLRRRNGVVSQGEIDLLNEEREALTKAVMESQVRLDAVRLVRVSPLV